MITPLKHRVLVQGDEFFKETETESGLLVIDSEKQPYATGVIIAVGPEADEEIQIGQRALYGPRDGTDIKAEYCDGLERCIIIADNQIRCIIGESVAK